MTTPHRSLGFALAVVLGACATPLSPVDTALQACIERIQAETPDDCTEPLGAHYETATSARDRDRIDRLLASAASARGDDDAVLFHLERRFRSGYQAAQRTSDLEDLAKAAAVAGDTPICVEVLGRLGRDREGLAPGDAWRLARIARACPAPEDALVFVTLAIDRAPKPIPAWKKERARLTRELGRYHENARLERDLAKDFRADALSGSATWSQRWSDEIERVDDDRQVASALEARCEEGALPACEVLSYLRLFGGTSDRDRAAGLAGIDAACARGSARACQWRATRRRQQDEPGEQRTETLALLDRACEAGSRTACVERGDAYELGVGGAVDLDSAQRLYRKACRAGLVGGCNALFVLQETHDLLTAEVREDVEAGCRARHRVSCTLLANHAMGAKRPWPEIEPFAAASCALGQTSYCGILGVVYELGDVTPRDLPRALDYYQHACMAGHARACDRIGPVEALLYSDRLNERGTR